jgi:hypothetical protein
MKRIFQRCAGGAATGAISPAAARAVVKASEATSRAMRAPITSMAGSGIWARRAAITCSSICVPSNSASRPSRVSTASPMRRTRR